MHTFHTNLFQEQESAILRRKPQWNLLPTPQIHSGEERHSQVLLVSLPFEKFRVRTRPKSFLQGNIPISPCSVHFSSCHTFPMTKVPTFCSRPINPTLPAHIQVQGLKVNADMRQLPLYFLEDGMR